MEFDYWPNIEFVVNELHQLVNATGRSKAALLFETLEALPASSITSKKESHERPSQIPVCNFNTTKMFVAVKSIEDARSKAEALGGEALEGEWSNSIFRICNIADPEGNHIQLREFTLQQ